MTANRQAAPGEAPAAEARSYVLEEQIGFLIRRAHQRASAIFDQVMDGFDVTPVQYAALAKLHDLGPTSQNALGRLVGIDPATMFGVAGRRALSGKPQSVTSSPLIPVTAAPKRVTRSFNSLRNGLAACSTRAEIEEAFCRWLDGISTEDAIEWAD